MFGAENLVSFSVLKLQILINYIVSLLWESKVVAAAEKGAPPLFFSEGTISYLSCNLALVNTVTFCKERDFACNCFNPAAIASIAGCINYGNEPNGIEEEFLRSCEKNYAITIAQKTFKEAYYNYTKYARYTSEIDGFNETIPVSIPIKLDATMISDYRASFTNFLGNYNSSIYYAGVVLGYWAIVFLLATGFHWAKFLCPGLVKRCTGPFSNFCRRNISLPALGNRRKTNEVKMGKYLDFLAPSRIESIIIFGFCVVTVFCSYLGIHWVDGDPIFHLKLEGLLRFVADRTGIIATVMMPMLILFAGRNNILQWITGINFATYVAYHKWMGRVIFVLVVIHAACFTAIFIATNRVKKEYRETYMIWGAAATYAGLVIWVQSILYFRRNWYEVFLIIHIVMAALFIGGAWIHVDRFGYVWFLYATVAIWCFDRAVRVARLIHFGFPKATVSLLANDTLKVVVRRPHFWPAIPGGHAFIHFLRPSCFWQSHPFTFTVSPDSDDNVVIFCKVKGGVTHGLYQYLHSHPGKTTQIRVTLEGPYGEPTPAKVYDSAVFVAGGSGIPGIYSEALDLALSRSFHESNKLIKLYWVVRDYDSLFWFYDEISALRNTNIQCTICVTRPTLYTDYDVQDEVLENTLAEQSSAEESLHQDKKLGSVDLIGVERLNSGIINKIKNGLDHVTFLEGRPSVENLVRTEIEESPGSVAFITCGHPIMVDDLRYYCANSLDHSKGKRIDFFEQLQVWA